MARKTPSLKTKLASALLALGHVPYDHAKKMTADQLISLYQFDHGMLHESEHPQRDAYWNLTPMLVKQHRNKTRRDAAIIAKGRRIRKRHGSGVREGLPAASLLDVRTGRAGEGAPLPTRRKLRSRGFDKRYRRHLDGTVTKR